MYKTVVTTDFGMDEESVIFSQLADMLDSNVDLSKAYYESFKRTPKQQEIRDIIDTCDLPPGEVLHLLIYGSVGGAKTWSAFEYATDMMFEAPGCNILAVRASYDELEEAFFNPIQDFWLKFGVDYTPKKKPMSLKFANRSRIVMRSSERTKRSKSDKADELGGTKYSVAILDESDSISEEFATTVTTRMRDDAGVSRKVIFYICNPPSEDHWLHDKFFVQHDHTDPRSPYRAIHVHMKDNPHLPEGYEESVRKSYAHNPALYRRMFEGKFGPAVKGYPIFATIFNENLHISEHSISQNWNRKYPIQRCWDFGWRRPAVVVFQDDRDTGQIRIFNSWLGSKVDLYRFSEQILTATHQAFPGAEWEEFVDPAGVQKRDTGLTSIDILRSKGLRVKHRITSLEYRVALISELLGSNIPYKSGSIPSIIIDPAAGLIINAIQLGYAYDKDHKEDSRTPIKIEKDGYYEHLLDAFSYGIIFKRKPNFKMRRDYNQGNTFIPLPNPDPDQEGFYHPKDMPLDQSVFIPKSERSQYKRSTRQGPLRRGTGQYSFKRRR